MAAVRSGIEKDVYPSPTAAWLAMSGHDIQTLFDPTPFYPALALIRIPRDPQTTSTEPAGDDEFGTGSFATKNGTLFTAAHNLTEDSEPGGKPLPWVWVCCYNPKTHDWTDPYRVNVDPNLIKPKLDAAILLVDTDVPAPLRSASDWQRGDNVVVLGFQPDSSKKSGFTVHHLLCEIPTGWPVAPLDLKDVHGEPTLRLGISALHRGQQPLGKGMSGSPVLDCECDGDPAIAIVKAIEWPEPPELRPPEVKTTALGWLCGMIERLPAAQRLELPAAGTSRRKGHQDRSLSLVPHQIRVPLADPVTVRLAASVGGIERIIEITQSWQTNLNLRGQRDIQIMLGRLQDLLREQRLFGKTDERQAEIWEVIYNLDIYFFQHLGVSLLMEYLNKQKN